MKYKRMIFDMTGQCKDAIEGKVPYIHPLEYCKQLGFEWERAECNPIADMWALFGVTVPDGADLPEWIYPKDQHLQDGHPDRAGDQG